MKKYLLFTIYFISIISFAQSKLVFDKKFVQSEDKWVAFQADSTGSYNIGFIYIDAQAGLTFDYEGSFKIDENGKFNFKKREMEGSMKYRLKPNNVLVAFIPESKFSELGIKNVPDWLKFYKENENTVGRQYRWGFMYNGWGECEKALTFLEKAEKINPNYTGLQTELAYSYNALENFPKAEIALKKAVESNPNDCYTLKELAYTYKNLNKLNDSGEVYYKMVSVCAEKNFLQETAYNLAHRYYEIKDKNNFTKWSKEVKKWSDENNFTQSVDILEKELK